MKIYYRTSDEGYKKEKPDYVNWENCLKNFTYEFHGTNLSHMEIIADNVSDDTFDKLQKYLNHGISCSRIRAGSGAASFNVMLDKIFSQNTDPNEIIYMVENDYIFAPGALQVLQEVFDELNPSYSTTYDHPDKYLPMYDGGETTKVFNTKSCAWKLTISTTMTFAARLSTLKEDEPILREFTKLSYPRDHDMFCALRKKGRTLVSSLPAWSTHGESAWLSPHRDWEAIMENSVKGRGI